MDSIAQQPDIALVHGVLEQLPQDIEAFTERMQCVPRILRARNARMGRPLDAHDLADVAQDTLVIVLRKLGDFVEGSSLEGWVYRICCYELMNHVRRKRRQPRSLEEVTAPEHERAAQRTLPPWEFEDLYRGLDTLELSEADIIRLKFFEESTFQEIAERLAISSGTVKTRYYRGLIKLQEFLANRERLASRPGRDPS